MRKFVKNHYIVILIVLSVIVISSLIYSTNSNDSISEITHTIFNPIQSLFSSSKDFVTNTFKDIEDFGDLQEERDDLSKKVSLLKVSDILLKEARIEIKHLESLLNYSKDLKEMETMYARVISRNPNNWFNSLTIDLGESDGVVEGMSVIAIQEKNIGLVGIIDQTTKNTSKIHLLIDPSKNIAAAAKTFGTVLGNEEASFDGIIEGSSSDLGTLKMIYISHEARINSETEVISTGLGGFYVPGLPIGRIQNVNEDAYGLLQTAIVKPNIDFTRISDVLIIKSPLPNNIRSDQNE